MHVRTFISTLALVSAVAAAQPMAAPQAAAQGAVRTVAITVSDPVGDKMTYSIKTINAKPGERLRIRLISIAQTPKIIMKAYQ